MQFANTWDPCPERTTFPWRAWELHNNSRGHRWSKNYDAASSLLWRGFVVTFAINYWTFSTMESMFAACFSPFQVSISDVEVWGCRASYEDVASFAIVHGRVVRYIISGMGKDLQA